MEGQGIFPINGETVEKKFRLWYNVLRRLAVRGRDLEWKNF